MDKIHKEGSYSDAFDTLMQVIDKNDIAFGNGQLWAIQMVKQACVIADVENDIRFGPWISVNDRLPRAGQYVIAYGDNGPKGCCMAFVGSDDEFICEINGYYVKAYGITHWMPLPEEPRE